MMSDAQRLQLLQREPPLPLRLLTNTFYTNTSNACTDTFDAMANKWQILVQKLDGQINSRVVEFDSRQTGDQVMRRIQHEVKGLTSTLERLLSQTVLLRRPVVYVAKTSSVCTNVSFQ